MLLLIPSCYCQYLLASMQWDKTITMGKPGAPQKENVREDLQDLRFVKVILIWVQCYFIQIVTTHYYHFDNQTLPNLAIVNSLKQMSLSFWYVVIILWTCSCSLTKRNGGGEGSSCSFSDRGLEQAFSPRIPVCLFLENDVYKPRTGHYASLFLFSCPCCWALSGDSR